jgi:hypothetical protein
MAPPLNDGVHPSHLSAEGMTTVPLECSGINAQPPKNHSLTIFLFFLHLELACLPPLGRNFHEGLFVHNS